MPANNLVTGGGGAPWYQLFNALGYVNNPFALFAFLFLVCIFAINFVKIDNVIKMASLVILSSCVLLMIFLLLRDTLNFVESKSLIRLINTPNQSSAQVSPKVTVKLMDVTSLEGKTKKDISISGVIANRLLPVYVLSKVLQQANVYGMTAEQIRLMDQAKWENYLSSLGNIKSDMVKDISFVKLYISIDNKEVKNLSGKWWLKGETIKMKENDKDFISITIVNIYNTKNTTSLEPEAINLKVS